MPENLPNGETRSSLIEAPTAGEIGTLARRGVKWTTAISVSRQIISMFVTAILARLLLPAEFGVMGMVGALTAFVATLSGLGLAWSTIQKKNLTLTQVNNMFWINTVAGIVSWLSLIAMAPLLAKFYRMPELTLITIIISVTFVIDGLAIQPLALLQRRMDFRKLAILELVALLAGATIVVPLAFLGWGYWSLVARALVTSLVSLMLAFGLTGYRPSLPKPDPETRSMISVGGYIALSGLVTYFSVNTDNILIGRVWGAEELGFYSRAYFLTSLPVFLISGAIGRVFQPALAAVSHDPELLTINYRKALAAMSFVGFPLMIGLLITAPEAIRLVYGSAWLPVVPIYSWLAVSSFFILITGTTLWLLAVTGRTNLHFRLNLVSTALLVLMILATVQRGVVAVAMATAVWSVMAGVPRAYITHRLVDMSFRESIWPLRSITMATMVMGSLAFSGGVLADVLWDQWLLTLATKIIIGGFSYGLLSLLWIDPLPVPIPHRLSRYLTNARRKAKFG